MHLSLLISLAAATSVVARSLPVAPALQKKANAGLRQSTKKINFSSHPFLGGMPVPRSAEEIAAAKQPGYVYWLSEQQNKRRSLEASKLNHV